ncbi:hypothetical protein BJ912DRAFT_1000072, partial [Pholiota molesta]
MQEFRFLFFISCCLPAANPTSRFATCYVHGLFQRDAKFVPDVTISCTSFLCRYPRAPLVHWPRSRVVWAAVARRLA